MIPLFVKSETKNLDRVNMMGKVLLTLMLHWLCNCGCNGQSRFSWKPLGLDDSNSGLPRPPDHGPLNSWTDAEFHHQRPPDKNVVIRPVQSVPPKPFEERYY